MVAWPLREISRGSEARIHASGAKFRRVDLNLADGGHGVVHPLPPRSEDALVEPDGLVLAGALGPGQVHPVEREALGEGAGDG